MNKHYLANVALKINVKVCRVVLSDCLAGYARPYTSLILQMGGRNTVLSDAIEKKLPHVGDTPTIIFGAVVSRSHPKNHYSPSIASVSARHYSGCRKWCLCCVLLSIYTYGGSGNCTCFIQVVASQDWPEVSRYAGLVSTQPRHHEWINNLFELKYDSEKVFVAEAGGMIRYDLFFYSENLNVILEGSFCVCISFMIHAGSISFRSIGRLDRNPRKLFFTGTLC